MIGPSLTFTEPVKSSPSTDSIVGLGMHGPIRSMSSRIFHASSMPTGTVKECSSFIDCLSGWSWPLDARRGEDRALGEYPCQVLTVVGLSGQVGRGTGALGGVLGRRADRLVARVGAGERLLHPGRAQRRRAHVGQPDAGLGDRAVL